MTSWPRQCPACEGKHVHEGPTQTLSPDAGELWEGYASCRKADVPRGLRWDPAPPTPRDRLAFGGSPRQLRRHEWGAPYRRLYVRATGRTSYARYRVTREGS